LIGSASMPAAFTLLSLSRDPLSRVTVAILLAGGLPVYSLHCSGVALGLEITRHDEDVR
jgi:hypothetical protein